MRHIIYATIVTLLFIALFAFSGMSQANFSGEFKFASREHVKGPEYGNGVPTSITVEKTKDSIIIHYGSMDANNVETKNRTAFASHGKPVTIIGKTSGRKVIRSVKWSGDKKTMTTTSEIYKEGNEEIELTRIDEYQMSPDGKQMLFNRRSVETITESWEDKATYNKQ